jgi:hypothetical protein
MACFWDDGRSVGAGFGGYGVFLGRRSFCWCNAINLTPAAVGLIVGIADFTWQIGTVQLAGIAPGTMAVLVAYHLIRAVNRVSKVLPDPTIPALSVGPDDPAPSREPANVSLAK